MSNERIGRIGIIGNMNNNGFSIMRYFRDLGADAYILPYATDGVGNLSHFAPEADTWDYEKWRPFIRQLPVPNTTEAIFGKSCHPGSSTSNRTLNEIFDDYTQLVGSGVAPALLTRINRALDIFFPYGTGIEFYGHLEFRARMHSSLARRLVYAYLRKLQGQGIRRSRFCLNAEMSLTKDSFEEIGKPFHRIPVPMIYNKEMCSDESMSAHLVRWARTLRQSDLGLFCCARMMWRKNPTLSEASWAQHTKNSDWLFVGLSRFLQRQPHAKPVLCVVEYGPDVNATKRLVSELGLDQHVIWLPKMARKEIMLLLSAADIGVGEFYQNEGLIWGGTGWEVLASGRPLLQSFNFTESGYENEFGHPPPPILDVKSPDDVALHLSKLYRNPDKRRSIGQASVDWFNNYNGIGLARRWLDLLRQDQSARHE